MNHKLQIIVEEQILFYGPTARLTHVLIYNTHTYTYVYTQEFSLDAHCSNNKLFIKLEVFTAVTMMNAVFWDVTPCGSCKNRRFG
jgi:hypothetical protein